MPLSYDECLNKGLPKEDPSIEGAGEAIFLIKPNAGFDEAKAVLGSKAFNSSVSAAYLTMCHSARAILFLEGFREKSHVCVARYLAQYVQGGKLEQEWVDLLDHHREIRHEDQYDLGFFATEEDAKKALESAVKFMRRMKQLFDAIE